MDLVQPNLIGFLCKMHKLSIRKEIKDTLLIILTWNDNLIQCEINSCETDALKQEMITSGFWERENQCL